MAKKIRIGKDIPVKWTVLTNGEATSLENNDLLVVVTDHNGWKYRPEFTVSENVISFTYPGIKHRHCGPVMLTLWDHYDSEGQNAVDIRDAFSLTPTTADEGSYSDGLYLQSPLEFTSVLNRMGDVVTPAILIAKPSVSTEAEYTGSAIIPSITGSVSDGYTVKYYTGDTEIDSIVDVGAYTIKITLNSGYKWKDGTKSVLTFTFTVKAISAKSYIVKDNAGGKLDEILESKGYDDYDDCTYDDITENKSLLTVSEVSAFTEADVNPGGTYGVILVITPKDKVVSIVDSIAGASLVTSSALHGDYMTYYVDTANASGIMLTIK